MKFSNRFKTLEEAKKYALDNTRTKQIYIITTDNNNYYDVSWLHTDDDIPMIIEKLQDHMNHHNKYISGFTYYYNGWNDECKLFIDINY